MELLKNTLASFLAGTKVESSLLTTPQNLKTVSAMIRAFLTEESRRMVEEKLTSLPTSENRREAIIQAMKQTPLNYYFELVLNLNTNKCSEKGKTHLYYFSYTDRDAFESGENYQCLYCGGIEVNNEEKKITEERVVSTYKPIKKIQEAHDLFQTLIKREFSKKEMERFIELLVTLAM